MGKRDLQNGCFPCFHSALAKQFLPPTSVYYIQHPLFALRSLPSSSCPQPKVAAKSWEVVAMVGHTMTSSAQRTSHVLSNYSESSFSLRLPSLGDLNQCAQFLMLHPVSSGLTTQSQHQLCQRVQPPFFFFSSSVAPHNFGVRGIDVRTTSFVETQNMLLPDGG